MFPFEIYTVQIIIGLFLMYAFSLITDDSRVVGTSAIYALFITEIDDALYNKNILIAAILGTTFALMLLTYVLP
jgi:hypothetical protein